MPEFAYEIGHVDGYQAARRHGTADEDILHAVEHARAVGEQDDGKVLYSVQIAPRTCARSSGGTRGRV